MHAFEYASPKTLKEALSLLGSSWSDAAVLAGGTDLLALMKDEVMQPKRVVNIKAIAELGGIRATPAGLRIGATVTVDELANHAAVRAEYPSLRQAALGISSMQMRYMGTVGGDLCQRPRCWYFRWGHGILGQKDGKSLAVEGENKYHAIFGGGPAYFVSASSFGPALVALGAKIKLASATGTREVDADKFFVSPTTNDAREIVMLPNEIVTEIVIPKAAGKNATYEIRHRDALDWPLATASVVLKMKGTAVDSARVVLGHVAPTPWAAQAAERALAGKTVSESTAAQAGEAAAEGAHPLSQNAYKVQLVKTAVKRAILDAAGVKV